ERAACLAWRRLRGVTDYPMAFTLLHRALCEREMAEDCTGITPLARPVQNLADLAIGLPLDQQHDFLPLESCLPQVQHYLIDGILLRVLDRQDIERRSQCQRWIDAPLATLLIEQFIDCISQRLMMQIVSTFHILLL